MGNEKWNAYMRKYNKTHPQKPRPEKDRRRRVTARDLIRDSKQAPCADCGKSYPPYVMDFDHVRGVKKMAVSNLAPWGVRVVAEEIAKCDVVCSNCHRIRTHNRRAP